MSYIGNTVQNQNYVPAIDYFSGNGSTTAFTLSRPVASVAAVQAVISNVPQNPTDAFTVSGNTITFTSAPPSGTNNIYVYYTSPNTQLVQPGQGTVGTTQLASGVLTPTAVSDQANTSTGYFALPSGTTAQRPASPVAGMVRYNSTVSSTETYQNSTWNQFVVTYQVEYLIVAGGGAGGHGGNAEPGGGGGAGGYIAGTYGVSPSVAYSVVVGSGGSDSGSISVNGGVGNNSSAFGITATGGGGGVSGGSGTPTGSKNGGSGGGGNGYASLTGGTGTSGQGNNGGTGANNPGSTIYSGGGGGGASAAGANAVTTVAGKGGDGSNWQSLGTTYAGGGGGAAWSNGTIGAGGAGGGGAGGKNGGTQTGTAGTANTGGGGGAGVNNAVAGAGGSGIVIIRYPGSQRGTGGTVTSSGGYTYHTFTSSSTFTA